MQHFFIPPYDITRTNDEHVKFFYPCGKVAGSVIPEKQTWQPGHPATLHQSNQQCCVLLIALTALLVFSHHVAVAQEPCALPQNITYPPLGSLGARLLKARVGAMSPAWGASRVALVYDHQDYVLRGHRRFGANASFIRGLGWPRHAALEVTSPPVPPVCGVPLGPE